MHVFKRRYKTRAQKLRSWKTIVKQIPLFRGLDEHARAAGPREGSLP